MSVDRRTLRPSATFPDHVLAEIHRAADQGVYEIRGFGTKRQLPTFDDLLFLGASMSRYPLEATASAATPMSCSATGSRRSRSSSRSRSPSPA